MISTKNMAIETAKNLGTNGWPKNLTKITCDIYRYISYKPMLFPTWQPSLTTKGHQQNTDKHGKVVGMKLNNSQ